MVYISVDKRQNVDMDLLTRKLIEKCAGFTNDIRDPRHGSYFLSPFLFHFLLFRTTKVLFGMWCSYVYGVLIYRTVLDPAMNCDSEISTLLCSVTLDKQAQSDRHNKNKSSTYEMLANAQRDGRPAEYR